MIVLDRLDRVSPRSGRAYGRVRQLGMGCLTLSLTILLASIGFHFHLNLSTAGSLELLAVVLVALRWGFVQATVVSVGGVLCLDYFFTEPILQLSVADPQNYVSLVTFETTALLISRLSTKARLHASDAEEQRSRSVKLYDLSRAILLIDSRASVTEQLAALVREIIGVHDAIFWLCDWREERLKECASTSAAAHAVFESGMDSDVPESGIANRMLRVGTRRIGALVLYWERCDPLLADAVASLTAIAVERARSLQRENQAEAERNAEQLRTAVLDGLAHGFKTPLTAIQTASSGLIAIKGLNPAQLDLVSIINERTSMLSQLCTRLLKTAALESREIRLHRKSTFMPELLQHVIEEQDDETRSRIIIDIEERFELIDVDAEMVESAIVQLIDNAAKYSDVGSRIRLTLRQTEDAIEVIVESSGPAIEAGEQERIFQRFYRGSYATHGPTGTGLGLSIVKKTAEAHGGSVRVESAHEKTRFTFNLQRQ